MARLFGEAFETLSNFNGISIAAINGYAMGGGSGMRLACDLRIAAEEAILALPEASVGLLPCAGGTQNLSWLVGEGWAKRMILLGKRSKPPTPCLSAWWKPACRAHRYRKKPCAGHNRLGVRVLLPFGPANS